MDESSVEKYRQRYETWRHLDKARFQVVQLAIALFGAIAASIQLSEKSIHGWAAWLCGFSLILLWLTLQNVNRGIRANGIALRAYGEAIGDNQLPDVSNKQKSVFFYIELLFMLLGVTMLLSETIFFFTIGVSLD